MKSYRKFKTNTILYRNFNASKAIRHKYDLIQKFVFIALLMFSYSLFSTPTTELDSITYKHPASFNRDSIQAIHFQILTELDENIRHFQLSNFSFTVIIADEKEFLKLTGEPSFVAAVLLSDNNTIVMRTSYRNPNVMKKAVGHEMCHLMFARKRIIEEAVRVLTIEEEGYCEAMYPQELKGPVMPLPDTLKLFRKAALEKMKSRRRRDRTAAYRASRLWILYLKEIVGTDSLINCIVKTCEIDPEIYRTFYLERTRINLPESGALSWIAR